MKYSTAQVTILTSSQSMNYLPFSYRLLNTAETTLLEDIESQSESTQCDSDEMAADIDEQNAIQRGIEN